MNQSYLVVNGTKITNLLSYRIEADLYTADHAFSLELSRPETTVAKGAQCKLYVNGQLALTGITDRVRRSYDKDGVKLSVEGRDLMGLLVDSCCTKFMTLKGVTLQTLAETLIGPIPFINKSQIVYQDGLSASRQPGSQNASQSGPTLSAIDVPQAYAQVEPGRTVFDVLSNYAKSRGFMFFSLPDGTFVFGRPKSQGAAAFTLTCLKPGPQNNIISGEEVDDISRRFSQVTVMGQQQGTNSISAAGINTSSTATDSTFPFYKPYVTLDNNDQQSPALHARAILEKMKHDGYSLHYRTAQLTQNGRAWTINELCRVKDDVLGIDGTYLIFGRSFEMSRQGVYTDLKLGPPGLVA
jgi:prophage tail gpP-like protein